MTRIRNTNADQFLSGGFDDDVFFIPAGGNGGGDDQFFDSSGGDDRMSGGTGNDILGGGPGRDTLFGGDGNDQLDVGGQPAPTQDRNFLFGGNGDDTLQLGEGGQAFGGTGNDRVSVNEGAASVDGGTGRDHLVLNFAQGVLVQMQPAIFIMASSSGDLVISGFEDLTGTFFGDVIDGSRRGNTIAGREGDDRIEGKSGADHLIGGFGADTIFGGRGADVIGHSSDDITQAEDGNDTFFGGAGADRFVFLHGKQSPIATADIIADFRRGTDKIDLSFFLDPAFNAMTWEFIGTAQFSSGNQLRFADGALTGTFEVGPDQPFSVRLTGVTALSADDLILV